MKHEPDQRPLSQRAFEDISRCQGILDYIALFFAVGGGLGYMPKAPGTWGSLPGLLLGALIYQGSLAWEGLSKLGFYLVFFAILTALAYWSLSRIEHLLGVHDDGKFVADEVVGQVLAASFIEPTVLLLGASFLLFRSLDIAKPGPIGYLDRHVKGPWGTLSDDVLAGGLSAVILWLCQRAYMSSDFF